MILIPDSLLLESLPLLHLPPLIFIPSEKERTCLIRKRKPITLSVQIQPKTKQTKVTSYKVLYNTYINRTL